MDELPCDHDEQVQAVPGVGEVRSASDETHRYHLDAQFDGEESKDEVIEAFQDAAACRLTDLVLTWSVHPERQAVQQDHAHADPLKPRDTISQGIAHLPVQTEASFQNRQNGGYL